MVVILYMTGSIFDTGCVHLLLLLLFIMATPNNDASLKASSPQWDESSPGRERGARLTA